MVGKNTMDSVNAAETLGRKKMVVLAKEAVMECLPSVSDEVVSAAAPLALRVRRRGS